MFLHRVAASSGCIRAGAALGLPYLNLQPEIIMGKYVLGWILGVPAVVLVIAYFFFH